jgi:hypothetical protein
VTDKSFAFFFSTILLLLTPYSGFSDSLETKRNTVMKHYINLLGDGNYTEISHLFTNKAIVVSSSGVRDQPMHFYKTLFTQTITSPHSSLINLFQGTMNQDMMSAYFDFSWKYKTGKKVSSKFLDLFLFEKDSPKIKALYVFSNTFQEDIMKQLDLDTNK